MSKKEVVDTVSDAIEDQARTTMFMRLAEAKGSLCGVLAKLGGIIPREANLKEETKEELTTIVDFLLGRTEKEIVWKECKLFRGKVTDEIVAQWKDKRR